MSDIVERLSKRVCRGRGSVGGWVPDPVSIEARDEIVRLRAERDEMRDKCCGCITPAEHAEALEAAEAERDRLRQINEDHCRAVNTLSVEAVELTRERDRLRADFDECYADLGETIIKLKAAEAERDRLRDALKQVSMACDTYGEDQSFGDMLTVRRIQDLARAALKGDTQ